jgi:hypothetical protein
MKKKGVGGCIVVFLAGCALTFLLAVVYAFFGGQKILERKRVQQGPPSILVHSPSDGETIPTGTITTASAVASSTNPILRVELWFDGELFDTQRPDADQLNDTTTLHALFDLPVTAGPHMISWRAMDNTGLVGQSLPITIFGSPSAADPGVTTERVIGDGVTVVDVAADHNVDPNAIRKLNPGLGGGTIPAGTKLNVPDPNNGGGGQPPPADPESDPLPDVPPDVPMLQVVGTAIDLSRFFPAFLSVFPRAPSHLRAGFEDCTVRLFWEDNADNESHFNVWMQALGGPPRVIAQLDGSPTTGPAWYEFKSPSFGIYSFWVEVVNSLGGQASEIEWVAVNDAQCLPALASHLEIEAVSMDLIAVNWSKVYCYLSIEDGPEQRIPQDDSQFLGYNGEGSWNISEWAGGKHKLLIPIPADGEVSLEAECFAWLGNDGPNSLGHFRNIVGEAAWDGRDIQIFSNHYALVYRIHPFGPEEAQGSFTYLDPTLERPHILDVKKSKGNDPVKDSDPVKYVDLYRYPKLSWAWDGDEEDITNFTVFNNGEFFSIVDRELRERTFTLPSTCGVTYSFQVAANSREARSLYSDSKKYVQPPCPVMAEVQFISVISQNTDDDTSIPLLDYSFDFDPCDKLQIYYLIWATGAIHEERQYGGGNRFFPYYCDTEYSFKLGLGATEDTLFIPIEPSNPVLGFGTTFWESDFSPDNTFGETEKWLAIDY